MGGQSKCWHRFTLRPLRCRLQEVHLEHSVLPEAPWQHIVATLCTLSQLTRLSLDERQACASAQAGALQELSSLRRLDLHLSLTLRAKALAGVDSSFDVASIEGWDDIMAALGTLPLMSMVEIGP